MLRIALREAIDKPKGFREKAELEKPIGDLEMVVAIAVVGGEWWLHKHGLRLPQWRTPGQIGVRQVSCLHLILINSTDVVHSGLIFHL